LGISERGIYSETLFIILSTSQQAMIAMLSCFYIIYPSTMVFVYTLYSYGSGCTARLDSGVLEVGVCTDMIALYSNRLSTIPFNDVLITASPRSNNEFYLTTFGDPSDTMCLERSGTTRLYKYESPCIHLEGTYYQFKVTARGGGGGRVRRTSLWTLAAALIGVLMLF
jgi:hypothetical protein